MEEIKNRCLRIPLPIVEAVSKATGQSPFEIKQGETAFDAYLRHTPPPVREAKEIWEELKRLKPTGGFQKRQEIGERLYQVVFRDAPNERVAQTLRMTDDTGRPLLPTEEDTAYVLANTPDEYRPVVAGYLLEQMRWFTRKSTQRNLEKEYGSDFLDEINTRAFQVNRALNLAQRNVEVYADLEYGHEIDRVLKQAQAGDQEAVSVLQNLQQHYGTNSVETTRVAIWADIAQRNPELISPNFDDEISRRIRHNWHNTGFHKGKSKTEKSLLAQELTEWSLGLRSLDDVNPSTVRWLSENNLIREDGSFVGLRHPVERPDLLPHCPVAMAKKLPKGQGGTSFADELAAAGSAFVASTVGSQGDEAEAIGALLRTAYSEDEVKQVADFMRKRGYNIPENPTKEELYEALGRPEIYHTPPVADKMQPMATGAGEMPPLDPAAEAMLRQAEGLDPTAGGRLASAPTPSELLPPPPSPPQLPPADTFDAAVPPPDLLSLEEAPAEVSNLMALLGNQFRVNTPVEKDTQRLVFGAVFNTDFTPNGLQRTLNTLGQGETNITSPITVHIAQRINERSRFLQAEEVDGVYQFRLRDGADHLLEEEMVRVRTEIPTLNLYTDDTVKGYLLFRDLGDATLNDDAKDYFERMLLHRLIMFPVDHFDEMLPALAAHFAGTGDLMVLVNRMDKRWITETKKLLDKTNKMMRLNNTITAILSKQGFLRLGDDYITKEEWDDLPLQERWAFLEEAVRNQRLLQEFAVYFNTEPIRVVKFLYFDQMAPPSGVGEEEIITELRNPVVVANLLHFASQYGIDPKAIITGSKLFLEQMQLFNRLWNALKAEGLDVDHMNFTPEMLGGDFIKWFYRFMTERLRERGEEEAADVLDAMLKDEDVLGWDILKRMLGREYPPELEAIFGEALDNLSQVLLIQDEFHHKVVNKNFAELFVPVFAHIGRGKEVLDPITGEPYRIAPAVSMLSLYPVGGSYHSIGAVVEATYGMDKTEFFKRILPQLPREFREHYQRLAALGLEREFDIYAPQILADIIRGSETAAKTGWDFFNDLFKMNLVVFSPLTQLRNLTTNILLMSRAADANLPKVIREYWNALKDAKRNGKLFRELTRLDTAFADNPLFTAESEALLYSLNGWQRKMSWISRKTVFPKVAATLEAMGKYALMRLLLQQKYGKDWEKLYTQADLYEGLRLVNEWLVDYRFVPPAIDFLRRTLGLFPFITFLYTITSTMLTNPEKLFAEGIRTLRTAHYIHRISELLQSSEPTDEEERKLLPDYLKNNPLVLSWQKGDKNIFALDLTFWMPLGVFEGFISAAADGLETVQRAQQMGEQISPLEALVRGGGAALLSYGEWGLSQVGSLFRPIFEVMSNRNILTQMPIYEPHDPPSVRTEKILRHLMQMVPLIRFGVNAISPEQMPRGKAYEEPEDWLERTATLLLGLKKWSTEALAVRRAEEIKNKYQFFKAQITRISREPHMSVEQKERYIQNYLKAMDELLKEYEEIHMHYLPRFYPTEGREVYTDPDWYETIEEVLEEYETINE